MDREVSKSDLGKKHLSWEESESANIPDHALAAETCVRALACAYGEVWNGEMRERWPGGACHDRSLGSGAVKFGETVT